MDTIPTIPATSTAPFQVVDDVNNPHWDLKRTLSLLQVKTEDGRVIPLLFTDAALREAMAKADRLLGKNVPNESWIRKIS